MKTGSDIIWSLAWLFFMVMSSATFYVSSLGFGMLGAWYVIMQFREKILKMVRIYLFMDEHKKITFSCKLFMRKFGAVEPSIYHVH